MKRILVTGSDGFMGRNLRAALQRQKHFEVWGFDLDTPADQLQELAADVDLVFHLAGVNRPKDEQEFEVGNADLTRQLCEALSRAGRPTPLVMSSSIQAELDNAYGRSKRSSERHVAEYHLQTNAPVFIFRFPNVFGKWSRPNYNSVVATFCHNISRDLPVQVSDPGKVVQFVYIDDVVREFLAIAASTPDGRTEVFCEAKPVYSITLGQLHSLLQSFHEARRQNTVPELPNPLTKYLFTTYASFHNPTDLARTVDLRTDPRGWLFELIKAPGAGQVFVSSTRPGVTRGNHYHDGKVEKFCVVQGEGIIRLRSVWDGEVIEYSVSGRSIRVVDIPPGYTHSIENTGTSDMLTLFWANEIFDPQKPDTHPAEVLGNTAWLHAPKQALHDSKA